MEFQNHFLHKNRTIVLSTYAEFGKIETNAKEQEDKPASSNIKKAVDPPAKISIQASTMDYTDEKSIFEAEFASKSLMLTIIDLRVNLIIIVPFS